MKQFKKSPLPNPIIWRSSLNKNEME